MFYNWHTLIFYTQMMAPAVVELATQIYESNMLATLHY